MINRIRRSRSTGLAVHDQTESVFTIDRNTQWREKYDYSGQADGPWRTPKMRVKAPVGCSHVQVLSGAHLVVPYDRILELDESDAKPLLRVPGWMRA